jgi:hypothetical protein
MRPNEASPRPAADAGIAVDLRREMAMVTERSIREMLAGEPTAAIAA